MPSITYGGVTYIQCRHAIYCKKCKETVESKSIHDMKWCSCQSVGVDGGIADGNRILGNINDMETRCMYYYQPANKAKKIWLIQDVIENNFADLTIRR